MPRLFLGFELPESITDQLLAVGVPLAGARWQRADQLHLTLRFLGEVDEAGSRQIIAALSELDAAAPVIRLQGAGYFGGTQRPYALWASVAPEEPLIQLRDTVDQLLIPLALQPDRHSGFKPHVTLARIRGGDASASQFAGELVGLNSGYFRLNAVSLFLSRQTAQGSAYSVLHRFPLA